MISVPKQQTLRAAADLIRLEMTFTPLNENKLSNGEGTDEYENHLCMHRLMTTMLLMHPSMLHSENTCIC